MSETDGAPAEIPTGSVAPATDIADTIAPRIHVLRGLRVMLDADLAELYGIETRQLVQAVNRNPERFPADFMFQLDVDDERRLRSQIVISNAFLDRESACQCPMPTSFRTNESKSAFGSFAGRKSFSIKT